MNRKDYVAIAAAISEAHRHDASDPMFSEGWHAGLSSAMIRLADTFAADNPRFDRARFIAACTDSRED